MRAPAGIVRAHQNLLKPPVMSCGKLPRYRSAEDRVRTRPFSTWRGWLRAGGIGTPWPRRRVRGAAETGDDASAESDARLGVVLDLVLQLIGEPDRATMGMAVAGTAHQFQ
jgi:hypothetical protein